MDRSELRSIVENRISTLEKDAFQDFCDRLLIELYPNDFTPVRAAGNKGDMGCDGYCPSARIFFAAHATRGDRLSDTKKKIEGDLEKCLAKQTDVKSWVFLTNETLVGEVEAFADGLRLKYPHITIETWGHKKIARKILPLEPNKIELIIQMSVEISPGHFKTLDSCLSSTRLKHLRKDLIYKPGEYLESISKYLSGGRTGCLLTGRSGSGKTVLAIAYALQWRDKHPEGIIYYLDAKGDRSADTGDEWFRELLHNDNENSLFIIDNCHLSVKAVNTFCNYWESSPPKRARIILISRPKLTLYKELEECFRCFKNSVQPINPESIWEGIVQIHDEWITQQGRTDCIPIKEELSDPKSAEMLRNKCGHNLVMTRYYLEAWEKNGGRLSNIEEKDIIQQMEEYYKVVTHHEVLSPLSALSQFEVPAHFTFVKEHLNIGLLKDLVEEERMVAVSDTKNGKFYYIDLHSQDAAMIFRACVRVEVGNDYAKRSEEKLYLVLKGYLETDPENYIDVYRRTYASGNTDIHKRLLLDQGLQEHAKKQFYPHPDDMAIYLYALYHFDQKCSEQLLEDFTTSLTRNKELHRKWLRDLDGQQLTRLGDYLTTVSPHAGKTILNGLEANYVARLVSSASLRCVQHWIGDSEEYAAVRLGYDKSWRREVAKALDFIAIADKAEKEGFKALCWLMHELRKTEVRADFEKTLTSQRAARMCAESDATASHLNDFLSDCSHSFRNPFLNNLGSDEVVKILVRSRLKYIGHLLKYYYSLISVSYDRFACSRLRDKLRESSPAEVNKFLSTIREIRNVGEQLAQQASLLLRAP